MTGTEVAVPMLRWGILGTGWISTMFTKDLLADRPDADCRHAISAVGSSSISKGKTFVANCWKETTTHTRPRVYDSYQAVYTDTNVDIVYVGTPHSEHKKNCLDAIAAGKHVLCEKPLTINAKEGQEVVDAAREKGVFLMEAVWTRFSPLFSALKEELFVKKTIGDVHRMFVDFGNKMPLDTLPSTHRLKDPALGAGALLDIGIYALTYASVILGDWKLGLQHPTPVVTSSLDIHDGMDLSNVIVLDYPSKDTTGHESTKTAICTSSFKCKSPDDFARIDGSCGSIFIFGLAASVPGGFRILLYPASPGEEKSETERIFTVEKPKDTLGFFWEADAVARDIAAGRTENAVVPLDESIRMMQLMDKIRKDAGLVYPQDTV